MPTKWALDHLCQAPPKTRSEILKCYPRFSFKLAILSCTQAPAPGCIAKFGYPNKPAHNLARKKNKQTTFNLEPGVLPAFSWRHVVFFFPFWWGFGRVFQTNHPNHIALVIFFW